LSETLKIAAYASVHDVMVIPHGHSTPVNLHFSLAQSPLLTPLQEYLVKWNTINQHFLAHPMVPEGGALGLPRQAGLGMDLDPGKIERQTEVLA
jgi:L-alanine-DL-glutamate epimerase-like enolase superfamily enzyme